MRQLMIIAVLASACFSLSLMLIHSKKQQSELKQQLIERDNQIKILKNSMIADSAAVERAEASKKQIEQKYRAIYQNVRKQDDAPIAPVLKQVLRELQHE